MSSNVAWQKIVGSVHNQQLASYKGHSLTIMAVSLVIQRSIRPIFSFPLLRRSWVICVCMTEPHSQTSPELQILSPDIPNCFDIFRLKWKRNIMSFHRGPGVWLTCRSICVCMTKPDSNQFKSYIFFHASTETTRKESWWFTTTIIIALPDAETKPPKLFPQGHNPSHSRFKRKIF